MKHKIQLTVLLLMLVSSALLAQITYVPSYFITNEGERVECLIKDLEWNMNPKSFDYKLSETSEVKTETIDNVSLFQVETSKYERFTVDVDMSGVETANLSMRRGPEYKTMTVFLKYLIEGRKSLLTYKGEHVERYFVKSDNEVQQLIYKEYKTADQQVLENNFYQGQLNALLGFNEELQLKISNATYSQKSLEQIFDLYHTIECEECIVYREKKDRIVYLSIKPGLDFAHVETSTVDWYNGLDFGLRMKSCIALELEFILPFNKDKWSIFLEPTYIINDKESGFEYEVEQSLTTNSTAFVDYERNMINIPVGVRYYAFLSADSKLFADFSVALPVVWNSGIKYYTAGYQDVRPYVRFSRVEPRISLGLGYNYKNYAAQIRYNGINQQYVAERSDYVVAINSISLHLAYKFNISNIRQLTL